MIQKNEVVFLGAKDYYQITNTGTRPLVLFGNRCEAFGGAHVRADGSDRNVRHSHVDLVGDVLLGRGRVDLSSHSRI